MARQIFIVTAQIVDANGSYAALTGYPKTFDSKNYQDDIDKAQRRAEGDFSDCWGAMCKRDDRQVQTVILNTADGFQLDAKTYGSFPEPVPNAEPAE